MQGKDNSNDEDGAPEGGGAYARSEKELYEKAIKLLEKCKIEPQC